MTTLTVTLALTAPAAQAEGSGAADMSYISRGCPPNTKPVHNGCVPRTAAHVRHGERCFDSRRAVVFYRNLTWDRQRAREGELADRTPIVRGKSCRWARFAAREWQARARAAAETLARWRSERTLRDFTVRPGENAWLQAVDEAQKPYPGTAGWLVSCSASEGGHGRWVLNGHGAGGWMQFLSGTFWRMWRSAKADVERRGYRVPRSAASWSSPLGQALAGAWGFSNGRRHEWFGRGC